LKKLKTLGIVGGLGPVASVRFYELITSLTPAKCDREHIDVVLFSRASIPDRTAFLTGASDESPLPAIIEVVGALNSVGVDYVAVPCVTAHCFMEEIRRVSHAPVISMIEETVLHLRSRGVKSAKILATDGTVKCGLLQESIENAGVQAILPDAAEQRQVMAAINAIKAGQVSELEVEPGADVSLLACTELSLLQSKGTDSKFVDCMEILARKAIQLCSQT
jgi:aspartate racemase